MLIKNVVFDLGNVILNINPELSVKEFSKLGIPNFDKLYTLSLQTELFDDLETGRTNAGAFCEKVRIITNTNLHDSIIIDAWNALILDFPQENLELLKRARNKYRTFILSNTNRIHYEYYTENLNKYHDIQNLESLVEKAFFSHEIGLRKPDKGIFNYMINITGIDPSETLFIDDSRANCRTAEMLGFFVEEYREKNLPQLFRKLNLPF
ncbi:MAG: HAD family phosphatase [Bacteroidales bacterium]|nr:HAD family phosphatase [Bacteroidales bacterium]HOY38884.1 HAD family phosphatase [Bacteroidales bacterium]HQP04265.1 HAD family phosphatase [Bacteroidales bacterium]